MSPLCYKSVDHPENSCQTIVISLFYQSVVKLKFKRGGCYLNICLRVINRFLVSIIYKNIIYDQYKHELVLKVIYVHRCGNEILT